LADDISLGVIVDSNRFLGTRFLGSGGSGGHGGRGIKRLFGRKSGGGINIFGLVLGGFLGFGFLRSLGFLGFLGSFRRRGGFGFLGSLGRLGSLGSLGRLVVKGDEFAHSLIIDGIKISERVE